MIELTKEEARDIVYGDAEGWEPIKNEIIDTTRWSIVKKGIFKNGDKYYKLSWTEGATEYQDESPFEYDQEPIIPTEVERVETKVYVWKPVKKA